MTECVLAEFRALTPPGSTFAISVSNDSATSRTHARFQQRVAALGEPARTFLTFNQTTDLLSAAGWELGEVSDRQRSVGLLLARAASAPDDPERKRLTQSPPPTPAAPQAPSAPSTAAAPHTPLAPPAPEGLPAAPAAPAATPAPARRQPPSAAAPGPVPAAETPRPSASAAPGLIPAAETPQRSAPAAPGRAASDLDTRDTARPAPALPASLPLSALLSQALVAFTIEADNETEQRLPHRTQNHGLAPDAPPGAPWLTSLLMYANCLRHLPDEGITIAELVGRARTATNLDGMRRWGYVTFTLDPGDPSIAPESPHSGRARVHRSARPKPDTVIRPTAWGIAARDTWRSVTAEVESRWRGRLGDADFAALRTALVGIVAQLDPHLPDCLPILHHGLLTRRDQPTAAGARPAVSAPPQASAAPASNTGAAMPPEAAPVADLPLWALLSRPLLAFAWQYEAEPGPSLAISANVLRVLPDAGVRVLGIPALGGISRESVAMALGVLRPRGLVTEGPDPAGTRFKITRLTARGIAARDEYPALAAGIECDWRARFGDATVTALRQALEPLLAGDPPRLYAGLEPYPDGWRARLPRPATLPHYPMTLHRGGYPDGS